MFVYKIKYDEFSWQSTAHYLGEAEDLWEAREKFWNDVQEGDKIALFHEDPADAMKAPQVESDKLKRTDSIEGVPEGLYYWDNDEDNDDATFYRRDGSKWEPSPEITKGLESRLLTEKELKSLPDDFLQSVKNFWRDYLWDGPHRAWSKGWSDATADSPYFWAANYPDAPSDFIRAVRSYGKIALTSGAFVSQMPNGAIVLFDNGVPFLILNYDPEKNIVWSDPHDEWPDGKVREGWVYEDGSPIELSEGKL